jgi:phosphatidylglycerol:prolipoprotein diacylglycerol transferase
MIPGYVQTYPALYPALVALGFLLVFIAPNTHHIQDARLKRQYYALQFIMLISAAIGAKLSVMWGDWDWPMTPMTWIQMLDSGRSITGGLLLGFWGPELAKWLMKYPLPPNDYFAARLPFSFAVGRIGCFLGGCCRGGPWDGFCSISYEDGIARHPAQLYEVFFQLAVGVVFLYLAKRKILFGRLFCLYLILYGAFRFLTEFIRDTPKYGNGFSAYQMLALMLLFTGLAVFWKRSVRPPASWQAYGQAPA